jgi:hypothetical protein
MKIRPVGAELFHADRRTGIKNLIVFFSHFSKAPKNTASNVFRLRSEFSRLWIISVTYLKSRVTCDQWIWRTNCRNSKLLSNFKMVFNSNGNTSNFLNIILLHAVWVQSEIKYTRAIVHCFVLAKHTKGKYSYSKSLAQCPHINYHNNWIKKWEEFLEGDKIRSPGGHLFHIQLLYSNPGRCV